MTSPHDDQAVQDDRFLVCSSDCSGCGRSRLRPALDEASTIIAETFDADKVDVFVYQAHRDSLVALGTSQTPLGRRQRALGLDVLPLANGGRAAWAFREGVPYATGRADEDPEELRGLVRGPRDTQRDESPARRRRGAPRGLAGGLGRARSVQRTGPARPDGRGRLGRA